MLPKDPMILLSYVNTQLRDGFPSLEAFCDARDEDRDALTAALAAAGYRYDETVNQFRHRPEPETEQTTERHAT